MITLASLSTACILLAGSRVVWRTLDPARARRRATLAAGGAFLVAVVMVLAAIRLGHPAYRVLGVAFRILPEGGFWLTNLVACAAGLLAVAMSPLRTHPPATLGRMLVLFAIGAGFMVVSHAAVLVALWALSMGCCWSELRSRPQTAGTARLFARYQVPSAALVLLGVLCLACGLTTAGFVACFLGIALREAVMPLHGWFPSFVQRAPLGIVVAFSMPQLGVYAHMWLLAAEAPSWMAHGMAALAAVTAVLAAGLGVVQREARRAVAFLVMSQSGLIAFGIQNESPVGLSGALLTWQVLTLATSGLAMTLAALEARRGTLSLRRPCGSFARTPRMAVAFLFLGFASVGLPLTLGFVAEDLLVQGSIDEFPILGFALILATAINGMTVMGCFFALFSGSRVHSGERDLTPRERWALTLAMGLLVLGGLFPARLSNEQGVATPPDRRAGQDPVPQLLEHRP